MKLHQFITCAVVIFIPYIIIHKFGPLKKYKSNNGLTYKSMGYCIVSHGAKILLMATGIPELLSMVIGEKILFGILHVFTYLGMVFPLATRSPNGIDCYDVILAVGLGWSLGENLGRLIFEAVTYKQHEEMFLRIPYVALTCNMNMLAGSVIACILSLGRKRRNQKKYLFFLGILAALVFPVYGAFNELKPGEATGRNFALLGIQALLGILLGLAVEKLYIRLTRFGVAKPTAD